MSNELHEKLISKSYTEACDELNKLLVTRCEFKTLQLGRHE
jgi:hypothetical protein